MGSCPVLGRLAHGLASADPKGEQAEKHEDASHELATLGLLINAAATAREKNFLTQPPALTLVHGIF